MKTIAVTKPEMSVLDHRRLPLSPFGVLAQTFAEEVLARSAWEEGIWPSVPLALLEEETAEALPGPPSKVTLQVDLHLVLEALRRQEGEKITERIVERVLARQSSQTGDRKAKEKIPAETGVPSLTVLGTIHQSFHQHLTQTLRAEPGQGGAAQSQFPPGRLARQAEAFSRRLQTLREEGRPQDEAVPLARGTLRRVTGAGGQDAVRPTAQGLQTQGIRPTVLPGQSPQDIPPAHLPPQALEYLQEQGEEAAQEALRAQTAALLRQEKRLESLLREEGAPVQRRDAARRDEKPAAPEQRRETGSPAPTQRVGEGHTAKEGKPGEETARSTSPLEESGAMRPTAHQPPTTARDIRVGPTAAVGSETTSPVEPGQLLPPQPSVELSYRTEAEEEGTAGSASPTQRVGEAHKTKEGKPGEETTRPTSPLEESRVLSPAAHQTATTARDIRVGPTATADSETTAPGESGQTQPVQPPVELSYRTEAEEEGTAGNASPTQRVGEVYNAKEEKSGEGTTRPASPLEESGSLSATTRQPTTTARDIRVGPTATVGSETTSPVEPGQPHPVQPPVELSYRTETEEEGTAGSPPTAQHVGEAHKAKEATPGGEATRPTSPLEEGGSLSPTARQTATTARDIRVGPTATVGSETTSPVESEQPLPVQPPVELSYRTEAEEEGTAGSPPTVQRVGETHKTKEATPGGETTRPTSPLEESGSLSATTRQPTTTARDIRVGPTATVSGETTPPAEPGQILPTQPPVELSYRTEAEEEGTAGSPPTAQRVGETHKAKEEKPGEGTTRPTSPLDEGSSLSPTTRQPTTTARDIRVGPTATVGSETTSPVEPGQAHPVQPPVELSYRTEAEEEGTAGSSPTAQRVGETHKAKEATPGGETTRPTSPLDGSSSLSPTTHQPTTTARDIRVGPTATVGSETTSPAEPGQTLPLQPPVELSHRTEEGPAEITGAHAGTGSGTRTPGHPSPQPGHLSTTARDIRVGPGTGAAAAGETAERGARHPEGGPLPPPPEMILGQGGQAPAEGTAPGLPQTGSPARTGQPVQPQTGRRMPAPLTLSYGPVQPAASPPPPAPAAGQVQQAEESEYVRSLPDWARRFLRESAPGTAMGVARDIATLPQPAPEETIQWTAPNYRPPEAPVTLREPSQPARSGPAQEVHITDAEIQRTADRVYQLLEDRIRRERRRLGL